MGTPFTDFNVAERRTTLRNVPANGLFSHSCAPAALADMSALFDGGTCSCHVQIATTYDYLGTREPRVAALLKDNKASVDPDNRINPGSLGLGV